MYDVYNKNWNTSVFLNQLIAYIFHFGLLYYLNWETQPSQQDMLSATYYFLGLVKNNQAYIYIRILYEGE